MDIEESIIEEVGCAGNEDVDMDVIMMCRKREGNESGIGDGWTASNTT